MKGEGTIHYLQRHELNTDKWDACISHAANGLIYGYGFYLDAMAGNWDALVLNDYEAIMPLPWRKKWGIHYLYQPFLTAQLGVFGRELTADTVKSFLQAVPTKFRYWDFSLNHHNLFVMDDFPLHQRVNYVLTLQQPYSDLYKNYRENSRRNIKKSVDYGCSIIKNVDLDDIIALTKLQAKKIPQDDFDRFKNLFRLLKDKSMGTTYGIQSKKGELLASAAFIFSHNRAYYILVGNHPNGRTLGASHALIDAFIQDHAGSKIKLDFEGSDIRNLAFFYSSFGATEEKYAAILLNRLPWWVRWLKN